MPGTSPNRHETDEEDSQEKEKLGFEGLKPMLIETINFNAQLCSPNGVAGAKEHYKELKTKCEKFYRLLCKASAAEEH